MKASALATAATFAVMTLTGCASAPLTGASSLSAADNLRAGKSGRTMTREFRDPQALAEVRRVYLHPTRLATGAETRYELKGEEKALVLAEVEAQLCFELAERYEVVADPAQSDAEVHSAVTWFEPTGTAGSGAAAAVNFFIPGPLGLRLPGSLGGLGAEVEMKAVSGPDKRSRQVAALVWARQAQALGTDSPSFSRLGDALQFAEPFGDDAARVMSPDTVPPQKRYTQANDPCGAYGGRIAETGFIVDSVTGVYVPASRAQKTFRKKGQD